VAAVAGAGPVLPADGDRTAAVLLYTSLLKFYAPPSKDTITI
jgi:hypothetical protein